MLTAPLDLILVNLFLNYSHMWLIQEGAHSASCEVPSILNLGTSSDHSNIFLVDWYFQVDFQQSLLAPIKS